jgi:type I restriction-modification system DNA methylase subunit
LNRGQKALDDLLGWSGTSETDLYPYVREVFTDVFGYPKDHIRLAERGTLGKIPDLSLSPADVKPKQGLFWVVGEVKKERRAFQSADYRKKEWDEQLRKYVSADTVYALLIDPETVAVLRPDGTEIKTVDLGAFKAEELILPTTDCSLVFLHYKDSVCENSLSSFKEGLSPSRYIDVTNEDDRKKLYDSLRISTRELIDFSLERIRQIQQQYSEYQTELTSLREKVGTSKDEFAETSRKGLEQKYEEARMFYENVLKIFETHIGRQLPKKEDEARAFVQNLYATEGSSLVLARILFVRFLEDHDMTMRKVSNGGIKAFRDYHRYVKDDYQFLLTDAYKEAEHLYHRLFEQSVFDWSHRGDGQLSRLLLRIFYRLNAFDFAKISGDILGNLYERFLDVEKRKKLGEYYTPMYVAKYVLERIGFYENPAKLLDPACGSGTFLIAATEGLIDRLVKKGVKIDLAINQAVDLVHGLDINVFAAFIAQLQLIWHLLPYLKKAKVKELPELKVYGGINSLVHRNQKTLLASAYGLPTEAGAEIRDSNYRYIVGNPPYIRNERLKDTGPWRANYDLVDFRNSDIAYYFVARAIEGKKKAMSSWLDNGGRMCFVLPMGLCDSKAASAVRKVLYQYNITEITDLEELAIHIFPSPQASGRATVAPILLFVEKTDYKDHTVDLVQITEDAAERQRIQDPYVSIGQIKQNVFLQSEINPYGQILPKLRQSDIPVLRILMDHPKLSEFMVTSTPTYGISVAQGGGLHGSSEAGLLPIGKGLNISTFRMNSNVRSWVDLNKVRSKSIWGKELPEHAYAVSTICLTPQCAMFNPAEIGLNASTIIFVPKPEYSDFPWDALINSSVIRFLHLLVLRTALVGVGTKVSGQNRRVSWCTVYPRTILTLPVPKILLDNCKDLNELSVELRRLASAIASRWDRALATLARASKKPLALHDLDFANWQSDIKDEVDFRLEKDHDKWTLRVYADSQSTFQFVEGSYALLNVVKYLLDNRKVGNSLTLREFQNLMVPEVPETISDLIDAARDPNHADITEFNLIFKKTDEMVSTAFGLDQAQWKYIRERLANPPFDVLVPRWPWKSVEMREIQEYSTDRFA